MTKMKQELYHIYLNYCTVQRSMNDEFSKLIVFFEKSINYKLKRILTSEKDDLKQECLMIIDCVFRKKPLKMNKKYYYGISDYKKKHQINHMNWNEYYREKTIYRNQIGAQIIQKYLNISFDNLIKDSMKKKRPVLLLNKYDKNGIEYIEYIKSNDGKGINIESLLFKHIGMFNDRQCIIINSKLKHYRKGDCPNFRYITTSG